MSNPDGAPQPPAAGPSLELRQHRRRPRRYRTWLVVGSVLGVLIGGGAVAAGLYQSVQLPDSVVLPERTVVYYSDGKTPMAYLGSQNRRLLGYDNMDDAVVHAAVAAGDPDFWSDSVSPISRAVVRAVDPALVGSGLTTRARAYATARKFEAKYSRQDILSFYLNTLTFGRGAYGIEAAAHTYFGKTANRAAPTAQQVSVAQAIALVDMIGSGSPDPIADANGIAAAKTAFDRTQRSMVALHYLDASTVLAFPTDFAPLSTVDMMALPTGLVVQHALAELRQTPQFKDKPAGYIENGGFDIVTTVDARAQAAVQHAVTNTMGTQPKNLAAAAVIVEPKTGRVLAYYGGGSGVGADYAGWYYDADGVAVGYGEHAPGQTFEIYDMATALKEGVSLRSRWSSPTGSKEFPQAGRIKGQLGPVVELGQAQCQPRCTLVDASNGSLVIPFFDLTLNLGAANTLAVARDAGIDSMWTSVNGKQTRKDLRTADIPTTLVPNFFQTELGIGQYPVTVLDQANAMATFAAGGNRSSPHFVQAVLTGPATVYSESFGYVGSLGMTPGQIGDLSGALSSGPMGQLVGMASANKTGTAQYGADGRPSDAWMVGYTSSLASAVWIGDQAGGTIAVANSALPESVPAAIYRSAMTAAAKDMGLSAAPFPKPGNTGAISPPGSI
jgi:membrane peptidoglycan carboxypeptidase